VRLKLGRVIAIATNTESICYVPVCHYKREEGERSSSCENTGISKRNTQDVKFVSERRIQRSLDILKENS